MQYTLSFFFTINKSTCEAVKGKPEAERSYMARHTDTLRGCKYDDDDDDDAQLVTLA